MKTPKHPVQVDAARCEVKVNGKDKALSPKEFQVLLKLLEAKGTIVTRADVLHNVFGYAKVDDIMSRTVDQHIARLRRRLGVDCIRTVTNRGYALLRGTVALADFSWD